MLQTLNKYDVYMRTTLTLEPDVARRLRKKMADKKLTLKQAVNETLRAGLETTVNEKRHKFVVEPHACGFKAGVDLDKLNQLVDEMEAEAVARKLSR